MGNGKGREGVSTRYEWPIAGGEHVRGADEGECWEDTGALTAATRRSKAACTCVAGGGGSGRSVIGVAAGGGEGLQACLPIGKSREGERKSEKVAHGERGRESGEKEIR